MKLHADELKLARARDELLVSLVYDGAYAFLIYRSFGPLFTLVVMVVVPPHFGFYLGRIRQCPGTRPDAGPSPEFFKAWCGWPVRWWLAK